MKRVVVLYGGKSGEHEVSRVSAAGIVRQLDPTRFQPVLVGIRKTGEWILQRPALAEEVRDGRSPIPIEEGPRVLAAPGAGLLAETWGRIESLPCDLVFPVLHGSFGEDGTVQGLLEIAGLPYVGGSVLGSALGMDKDRAKALWQAAGIPVLPWIAVRRRDAGKEALPALVERVGASLGWPCFVKPACAGSSVGASKAEDPAGFAAALENALAWDERAIVEPFCPAREIECSVLGNTGAAAGRPLAFAPGEVVPSHEFYDYDAKYLDPAGARLDIPARIEDSVAQRVRRLAVEAFEALELTGLARVDFFLHRESGALYLNEVNTMPGFTSISMYPKMCEAGGLPYAALLSRLVDLALERHEARSAIRYDFA